METKIAILRGINVGGKRKLRMADLKNMLTNLGLSGIQTYIQSGNVIFQSNTDNQKLADILEKSIKENFDYEVPVIVRSSKELEKSIQGNPFFDENADINKLHLVFLKEKPSEANRQEVETDNFAPDRFAISDKDVFLFCEGKYHETKLSNAFFEKKLKVGATTRNWKTVLKLHELAHKTG
ncbi:DUF1697 domain-containing protein [Echinicola jeungdonensis]|uniref:DUF1697 domain-containing protein n=1 Tax=Echinicola jeungdonensis TaxID=709343 RepID=A0ABV5J8L7_9BACT|nr:DUF1697 domain-containing protein [Echinicola jeungdonensis]MDN3669388.1 DUF1697 domain-containing protein [Echinicola jeungdonensis]